MARRILLTSFQTWLPHQLSNASDDLLLKIEALELPDISIICLRQLPVDSERASQRAIATIEDLQPDVVICCGMAESRRQLTLESHAIWNNERIDTAVDLEQLVVKLSHTTISHNAGKFVCESLYYQVLKYLRQFRPLTHCLFLHVPILTERNCPSILVDFKSILEELAAL